MTEHTDPMSEDLVSPSELADILDGVVSERQIRRFCDQGMAGAVRSGRSWKINVAQATAWMMDPANGTRVAAKLDIDTITANGVDLTADVSELSIASVLEASIDDMKRVAATILQVFASGKFNPQASRMLKETLSELRAAELHVLEMRKADQRLMSRERHRFLMKNLAALFRLELEGMKAILPDLVVQAMTEAGLEVGRVDDDEQFEADPALAIRMITTQVEEETRRQLHRLADVIEASKLDELSRHERTD